MLFSVLLSLGERKCIFNIFFKDLRSSGRNKMDSTYWFICAPAHPTAQSGIPGRGGNAREQNGGYS